MKNVSCVVLSAPDTATIQSGKIDGSQLIAASFQAVFADATAVGVLSVEASNDVCTIGYEPSAFTPTHWSPVPNATVAVSVGGSVIIPKFDCSYRWLRVVYTRTSGGSTTVDVSMFGVCL